MSQCDAGVDVDRRQRSEGRRRVDARPALLNMNELRGSENIIAWTRLCAHCKGYPNQEACTCLCRDAGKKKEEDPVSDCDLSWAEQVVAGELEVNTGLPPGAAEKAAMGITAALASSDLAICADAGKDEE